MKEIPNNSCGKDMDKKALTVSVDKNVNRDDISGS